LMGQGHLQVDPSMMIVAEPSGDPQERGCQESWLDGEIAGAIFFQFV
jgi:hypothetical protein